MIGLKQAFIDSAKRGNGITFIREQGDEFISYNELLSRIYQVCSELQKRNIPKGTEVIIQCKDAEYFIYAFWACVFGDYVAVPIDTRKTDYKEKMDKDVVSILDHPVILFDGELSGIHKDPLIKAAIDLTHLVADDNNGYRFDISEDNDSERVRYIQFSSGSTGNVKGVALTEKNLLVNLQDVIDHLSITENDAVLTWQPLTHCYGLTTFHMIHTLLGNKQYLISTESFMRNPIRWMEKVNEYKPTLLGAIPFAVRHFLNYYNSSNENYNWDLSSVRGITVGGEQINKANLEEFAEKLGPFGLGKDKIAVAYGLAEATTIVCTSLFGEWIKEYYVDNCEMEIGEKVKFISSKTSTSFLSIGKIMKHLDVKICDESGNRLEENMYGRIFISGDSVIKKYYKNPEMDSIAFADGWLDTGDIGFIRDNELVITGRSKELIVNNGKKYSCIAIEEYIKSIVDAKEITGVVVSGYNDRKTGNERILAFCETTSCMDESKQREAFIELKKRIQNYILEVSGLYVDEVIPLKTIPKTYSGKIRRRELMNMYLRNDFKDTLEKINRDGDVNKMDTNEKIEITNDLNKNQIVKIIVNKISEMFDISITDYTKPFRDYGIISINIPSFVKAMESSFGIKIGVAAVFAYPTVNEFADMIFNKISAKNEGSTEKKEIKEFSNKLAIVGMSCRFPAGANSPEEFWNVLIKGKDGVVDIPESRWELEKFYDEDESAPGKMYCKKTGFLQTPVDQFDARLFNISPKEAVSMDPQQRLLLELTWEAFENADLNIEDYNGTETGVYVGISCNEYTLAHLYSGDLSNVDAYSLTGTAFSVACGRISYTFGFEGPCIAVDTACSSGLSAFHLACDALKEGDTDLAVVGGVNLILSPANSVGFSKLHATSTDGHSKAFDASANGYGRGEGGGVLLLKRYDEAIVDGDKILGVICATGINQDGKSNGLTAPNGKAQAKLIRKTLKKANLTSEDIDYMEMHGTGTNLGDPIEVNAVAETYGTGRKKDDIFYIGSVKSNIGHLEPASGMASIIKVLLSMKNEMIPANLHFNKPNPLIDWDSIPIRVVSEHLPWKKSNKPRRAAVSGFGFGGSNAHLILEENNVDNQIMDDAKDGIEYVLKMSAKNAKSLKTYIKNYINYFEEDCTDEDFPAAVYSANRGRANFEYRLAVTASDREEMINSLKAYLAGEETGNVYCNLDEDESKSKSKKLVFMYTGQGSQYLNMGKLLYETNPVFHDSMDECDKIFRPYILKSIVSLIYGENGDAEEIKKTEYAQPLIFSIEYALTCMWKKMGIKPDIVVGHSIGEYAAAVTAGCMDIEQAAKLVAIRGRLMGSAPGKGGMAAVYTDKKTITNIIAESGLDVCVAAYNAKEMCTISGKTEDVEAINAVLASKGIKYKSLVVSHGFHSNLMTPILDDFRKIASEGEYHAPAIGFRSCLTRNEFDSERIPDADYWTEHIRGTVDFYDTISAVAKENDCVFIEIGANRVLSGFCRLIFSDEVMTEGSLSIKSEASKQVASAIAMMYAGGVNIDWNQVEFHSIKNWKKIQVPAYPYDKSSYWRELTFEKIGQISVDGEDYNKILGQRIESKNMNKLTIFQREFRADNPYFMGEHIIFGTAISPAAAHISMLLLAVKVLKNPASCTLKSVELRTPLAVVEGEVRTVQICLDETEENKYDFEIISRGSDGEWVSHAKGIVITSDTFVEGDKRADMEEIKNLPADKVLPENGVYKLMTDSGFDLGIGFRRIVSSSCTDGGSVCHIVPKTDIEDYESYEVYPGVVDSVLQTQLCTLLDDLNRRNEGKPDSEKKTIIPYYLGNVSYNYRNYNELWVKGESKIGDNVVYSALEAYNDDGEVIIKMSDTMANMTDRTALLRDLKTNKNHLLYHSDWVAADNSNGSKDDASLQYVVISQSETSSEPIVSGLKKSKADAVMLVMNKQNEAEWKDILLGAINNKKSKIVYIPNTDTAADAESVERNSTACEVLFFIVKTIDAEKMTDSVKIKACTLESGFSTEEINVNTASVAGLMKSVSIEYPAVYDGLLITDSISNENLIREIMRSSTEESVLNDDQTLVSRLTKITHYKKKYNLEPAALEINDNSAYLITGGTGLLGMSYADCLIESGAKHIILMARSAPKPDVAEQIEAYKEKGITVEVVSADICDPDDVKKSLGSRIDKIKGIIHAAGCLNDKMIADLSYHEFEKVMLPKTKGLWSIVSLFENRNIDFLINLSSITSLLGNIGQSNYASANRFMNVCASYLQSKGIKAYTMCWGPWNGGGMAKSNADIDKNILNMGIRPFSVDDAKSIIHAFIQQPVNNLMILDINWKKFGSNTIGQWQENYVDTMIEKKEESGEESIIDKLDAMSMDERKEYLLQILQERCAKIMGFEKGQLPSANVGLREQGADSLMIFSMRTTVNKMLHTNLDVTTFYNYPTLQNLTDYILTEVLYENEVSEEADDTDIDDALNELNKLIGAGV